MNRTHKKIIARVLFVYFVLGVAWLTNNASNIGSARRIPDYSNSRFLLDGSSSVLWLPLVAHDTGRPSICESGSRPAITISGDQTVQYHTGQQPLSENVWLDARTATWINVDDYPVVLEGGPDICFTGGTIQGEYPYSTSWEIMHDTTALTFRTTGNTTVENLRIHNYGDGISFSRGIPDYSFHIIGAHLTHLRDDCVQNDYMYSGLIEDSLFDGCYTAFSAQAYTSSVENDGSRNVWTIRDSLVRLEPMERVYNDEGLIPGHGSFFKWNKYDSYSPRLALHDNIFRADQPSNSSAGLGLPEGKLQSCSNNIVVWLGDGQFPDPLPMTFNGKPCFTIVTDQTIWENAVQIWMDRY